MWNFRKIEPGEPERDPRETEFFKLTTPAEAVIREFIQNSLDAKMNNEQMVIIKINFKKVNINDVKRFLDDELKNHLDACKFLTARDYPVEIPCLILEDFGTTGLDGDFNPNNPDARDGNFYNFWWREGISRKAERKAGRWGLGKITFHIISKIRTIFGYTARSDKRKLLMGKSLLKTHDLNNARYRYYGYFSKTDYKPLDEEDVIELFKNVFGIHRIDEPGFSLVIPLYDDEIDLDSILKAAIRHYYYPILNRKLKLEIQRDNDIREINENTLIEIAAGIDWRDSDWDKINIREILEFIKNTISDLPFELRVHELDEPKINEESFGERLEDLKKKFGNGAPCKFQVHMKIAKKGEGEKETKFTIMLKRFPGLKEAFEQYIRSGILISEMKVLGKRPLAALLIAEDDLICEFLGDCETPAHTSWNERTNNFKQKYSNAVRNLRFIKNSINNIVLIIDETPHERYIDFLKEIFSIPITPVEEDEGEETLGSPVIPPIDRKPKIFSVSKIKKGFSVTLNPEISDLSYPLNAVLRTAYDTFRGDPFAHYNKFDFDFGSNSLQIEAQDCNLLHRRFNEMIMEVTGPAFKLEVTGFDSNRDLVVNIKLKERDNED